MRFLLSGRAKRDYQKLTKALQKAADKQLALLLKNLMHPSLRAKKYDETRDIWQGRISENYRFYFRINDDVYEIVTILKHPK
ncbi:MAG: hypothetical protein FD167_4514 [bacterium]|nr:MAG: hypothetical protein FD167_4514 [bacterium]TSC91162.1 MAG: hypothetical protein G01um10142_101 [Parcubacteria group bacterium Gr01-1014_2]